MTTGADVPDNPNSSIATALSEYNRASAGFHTKVKGAVAASPNSVAPSKNCTLVIFVPPVITVAVFVILMPRGRFVLEGERFKVTDGGPAKEILTTEDVAVTCRASVAMALNI